MPMVMTFCSSLPISILWSSWTVATNGQYAGAVVFCIFMGWLRHALARVRQDFAIANAFGVRMPHDGVEASRALIGVDDSKGGDAVNAVAVGGRLTRFQALVAVRALQRRPWLVRIIDVVVFGALAAVGFLNMLIVMSFNAGLLIAVVGGEMLGVLTLEPVGGMSAGAPLSAGETAGRSCH